MVSHTGEKHLHLLPRRVLRFIEYDKRFFQRTAAHIGQWGDFDDIAGDELLELVEPKHIGQSIIERPQIGIDFFLQVPRQESQFFPRFYGRTGEDDPFDFPVLQIKGSQGHGQVSLARAGRADAKGYEVLADGIDIALLSGRFRLD